MSGYGYWWNNKWYELNRDVHNDPLTEQERAAAFNASAGKFFDPHQGKHKIPADKRDKLPPENYHINRVYKSPQKQVEYYRQILGDPTAMVRHSAEHRASKSHSGIGMIRAAGEPLLNANPRDTVRALMQPRSPEKHPKDRMVRRVIVKATSSKAAQYNKGWNTHQWGIFSLKYSKGVVIVDHMGNESKTVFPSIGAALAAIRKIEMEIVK